MEYRNGMPAGCWGKGEGHNATSLMDKPDEDELTRAVIELASAVRAVRVPEDHGAAAECGVAGRQGPGAADLAARGVQGAPETETSETAVAERWKLHSAAAGAAQPRLEL